MQRISLFNKIIKTRMIALLVGFIMLLALMSFVLSEVRINNQKKLVELTHSYANFEDHIQTFLGHNSNLMMGFSAYIQTFENYREKDVYEYLGHLVNNNIYYIRNIGIAKNTTIIFNYPKTGNEKSIGTDLSKISKQAESIVRMKKTLKYDFDGPISLVQGGTGYIMRIPIVKNNEYWGLVSVVLKADKVKELFDTYAKESNLKVAIINKSLNNSLVYGEKGILSQNPIKFHSAFTGAEWDVYVLSNKNTLDNNTGLLALIAILGLLFTVWVTRQTYKMFLANEEIKSRNDSLKIAVMKDPLTGIYNRKYFDTRIVEETERVNRYEGKLSMIFFDLDHFKKVNDTYGHGYGDAVLKEVAATIKDKLRTCDIFARWGGEEFVILMPDTTLSGAVTVAEKLRTVLEAIAHPVVGKVTASFGVVEYITDEYIGSLFTRVDKALYTAKTNGRNVVFACESDSEDAPAQVRVNWLEEWHSGNVTIDNEHMDILQIGNDIIENSYNLSNQQELLELANKFLRHITEHFKNEEDVLESMNYQQLEEHMTAHRMLAEKTEGLIDQLRNNKISSQELFQYLHKEVLLGHMVQEDKNFFFHFSKS